MLLGCQEHDEFESTKQAFGLADNCYNLQHDNAYLGLPFDQQTRSFKGYIFGANQEEASNIFITATDLGTYLLFGDNEKSYFSAGEIINSGEHQGGHRIDYPTFLESEVSMSHSTEDKILLSPGEWMMEETDISNQYYFYNMASKQWMAIDNSGKIGLSPVKDHPDFHTEITLTKVGAERCSNFPESEVNAQGQITKKTWPNGDLWGIADAHEHLMQGYAGTQSFIHGTAFHKLGIEHALHDCSKHHGDGGSRDLFKYPGVAPIVQEDHDLDIGTILNSMKYSIPQYDTTGYPDFSYWPAFDSATHQATYYKWIERAYLGGVRSIVEYATVSKVQCDIMNGVIPASFDRRSCDEMESVDRVIDRLKEMERYIDAKNGGEDKGWFRIVYSATEARNVIKDGKLAVILGMEIENPFNCNAQGWFSCREEYVQQQLDIYYDKGIRAIFPTHKFNNAFGTGDGAPGLTEIFDFFNSGGIRDYIACDDTYSEELSNFESHGENSMLFVSGRPGGDDETEASRISKLQQDLNLITPSSSDVSTRSNVLGLILPFYDYSPSGHCQRPGLTHLGRKFIKMLMKKGMIIDASHYGTNALAEAFELFEQYDYPPVMTHGNNYAGKMLDLGGIQSTSFIDNCEGQERWDHVASQYFRDNYQTIKAHPTAYPALAFGHDFNGLAPLPVPRFGDNSQCQSPQDPETMVEYPFTTYGGDFVMDKQVTGNRVFDVNTDGMVTIGLFPDLIEQERKKGLTDDMMQVIYRGAEGYVRAWEKMERQGRLVE